jgi:hypothetical protein
MRYMIWRAAALNVLCKRDWFQDDADAREADDKLAKTMRWFWPDMTANGNYHGGNFWRPKLQDHADVLRNEVADTSFITAETFDACVDDAQRLDPLAEYAAMVLLLAYRAFPERSRA